MTLPLAFAVLFAAVGGFMLVLSLSELMARVRFMRRCGRIDGQIVDMIRDDAGEPIAPRVRFVAPDTGEVIVFTADHFGGMVAPRIGARAAVLYDPHDPHKATLDGALSYLARDIGKVVFCTMLIAIAFAF
ncbi:MAG: DUF3592 domain-containing protein [Geminicoccaceae bacterium]